MVDIETMLIGLKNGKAKQLLTDLAALDLIEIQEQITESNSSLSDLRLKTKSRMTDVEIDAQIRTLREEWQRII